MLFERDLDFDIDLLHDFDLLERELLELADDTERDFLLLVFFRFFPDFLLNLDFAIFFAVNLDLFLTAFLFIVDVISFV